MNQAAKDREDVRLRSPARATLRGLWRRMLRRGATLLTGFAVGAGPVLAEAPKVLPPVPQPGAVIAQAQPPMTEPPKTQPPDMLPLPRRLDLLTPNEECPNPRPGVLGSTPVPTAKDLEEYGKFVKELIDPRTTLDLVVGRPRLMRLSETPRRIQMGDESIATQNLINPTELTIQGRKIGTTVLNLWFADPMDKNKDRILSYLVRVVPDPAEKERLERVYKALQEEINCAFPDSHVCLQLVGDKLVVSGQAKDVAEATQILRVVIANAPGGGQQQGTGQGGQGTGGQARNVSQIPVPAIQPTMSLTGVPGAGITPGLADYVVSGESNVINLLRIPGEQQVMLKVTVAEINRQAARSIGVNFNIQNNHGVTIFSNTTGNLINNGSGAFGGGTSNGGGGSSGTSSSGVGGNTGGGFGSVVTNLSAALNNGHISLAITALRNLNYARSLAEPNLVSMNGQTASFLAGGQFPVPVVTGTTLTGLQGVSYVPFGVQLNFTPYITDKDRIRLNVSAVVSTLNPSTGTSIGGSNVTGINTRNFQTTVELREGQTMAVAGLIQTSASANATRVPFFGDLPFIGRLAAFDSLTSGEQELVVLITPELVHPMEPKEIPPLPGTDTFEPTDVEFYLHARLESRRDHDFRASVRTDSARMTAAFRRCEDVYIQGPHGYSEGPPQQ
jgi:pilus assembly protein CpaC